MKELWLHISLSFYILLSLLTFFRELKGWDILISTERINLIGKILLGIVLFDLLILNIIDYVN